MHPAIKVCSEYPRGCGYRKEGGYYLVSDGEGVACGRMPIPLSICPTCGNGIKPSRGWTWVDGDKLTEEARSKPCKMEENGIGHNCMFCPLRDGAPPLGKCGLLWIGEKFYSTPHDFMREAQEMGISRKIHQIPKGFTFGTWVMLAHRMVYIDGDFYPGVFYMFRPERIEAVVNESTPDEEIDALVKRGITPVIINRLGENISDLYDMLGIDHDEE